MSKIFLSHSSANNAEALALVKWLEENGWGDYFLDITPAQGLSPGERWRAALKAAADRCEVVLFLISPAWRDSKECLLEFYLAKQLGKIIFGAIIDATPLDTLSKEMTAEWQLCDLVAGAERWTQRVYHDPLVPETYISFAQAGLVRLKIGLKKSGLNPSTFQWPPDHDKDRAPYRGLNALEAEDAAVFFGREATIIRGLDTIRALRERGVEQMLVILGASGAGKSSFLRAGLWPRLKRDDRHFLPLPVIRPERAAMTGSRGLAASLEAALKDYKIKRKRAEVLSSLKDSTGLWGLLAELQGRACEQLGGEAIPPTVIIPIDQGEELFTADGRAEAERLLSLLGAVPPISLSDKVKPGDTHPRTIALIAIRSDSYERLQTEPQLELIKPELFDLKPMSQQQFAAVIEGPAARSTAAGRKLAIEPSLTDRLLQDAEGADALPLLSFILERLYVEHGGDGDLKLTEYEALGGVRGSIEAAVTKAFAEPERRPTIPSNESERNRLLHQAFVPWLARIDPETEMPKRRIARWEEDIPVDARPLLERLITARLLISDSRPVEGNKEKIRVVEVSHEALLRQWPTLALWLKEDAEALMTVEAVKRAAAEWTKKSGGDDWLTHSGERLDTAEALLKRPDFYQLLGKEGRDYLAACRVKEEAVRAEREAQAKRIAEQQAQITAEQERVRIEQKRTGESQRWSRRLLIAITMIIVAAGAWIVYQAREVGRQTSLVLATAARDASDAGFYDRGVRFAVLAAQESWRSPVVAEAQAQLRRSAQESLHIMLLKGHQTLVRSVVFSPDGGQVVTAGDNTARIWNAKTGQLVTELNGHGEDVESALFSLNGKRVITASSRLTRIWNAKTGQLVAELKGHQNRVNSTVLSPNGRQIVTASDDGTTRLWDANTGLLIAELKANRNSVYSAVFSPNGEQIATASYGTAWIWNAKTGQLLSEFKGHHDWVRSVVFSPSGKQIGTASDDHTARIWDAKTGQLIAALKGHQKFVSSVTFSPTGDQVVTASGDGTARIWDAKTGQLIAELKGHQKIVSSAVFSPNGDQVATASYDHTARIWDAKTGQLIAELKGHQDIVRSAIFSPNGQQIATTSDDQTIRIWNAKTSPLIAELQGHKDHVASAIFSPSGEQIVTASADGTARVWDANTGQLLTELKGHYSSVGSAVFSSNGKQVVTASTDGTARVWDARTAQLVAELNRGYPYSATSAFFSPNGEQIVTSSQDRAARLWDIKTGQLVAELNHPSVVYAIFSSNGERIATASHDHTARIWDAKTGQLLAELGHEEPVTSVVFSSDGQRVVTVSTDGTARVWDARTAQLVAKVKGHLNYVSSSFFSPNGDQVVTASGDGTARVWDAQTGRLITELNGHQDSVKSAVFSPNGQQIATASDDHTARIWDGKTGYLLAELKGHQNHVSSAVFSPDGRWVVTASDDNTARVWDVRWLTKYHDQELIEAVCREKLSGARILTEADVTASPILSGRQGEDVCAPSSYLARITSAVWVKKGASEHNTPK